GITPIQTNDIWWHLASGRYIMQPHVIPHKGVDNLSNGLVRFSSLAPFRERARESTRASFPSRRATLSRASICRRVFTTITNSAAIGYGALRRSGPYLSAGAIRRCADTSRLAASQPAQKN